MLSNDEISKLLAKLDNPEWESRIMQTAAQSAVRHELRRHAEELAREVLQLRATVGAQKQNIVDLTKKVDEVKHASDYWYKRWNKLRALLKPFAEHAKQRWYSDDWYYRNGCKSQYNNHLMYGDWRNAAIEYFGWKSDSCKCVDCEDDRKVAAVEKELEECEQNSNA